MLGYSNAMATAATALDRQSPWRDELRATLALAIFGQRGHHVALGIDPEQTIFGAADP